MNLADPLVEVDAVAVSGKCTDNEPVACVAREGEGVKRKRSGLSFSEVVVGTNLGNVVRTAGDSECVDVDAFILSTGSREKGRRGRKHCT